MKQTMQKIAIALCMALAFAACKNDDPETGGGVESVTVSGEKTVVMGDEITLTANVKGTPKKNTYTWDVAGTEGVVSYDKSGTGSTLKIKGVKKGSAIVTATVDGVKSNAYTVTVTEKDNLQNKINITLNHTTLTLKVDEAETLVPTITGTDSKTVTWKSSDETVATVANGTVTAKKNGTARITVTLTADKTKTATCDVTVVDKDEIMPENVTLDKNTMSLEVGGTGTLMATITNASVVKDEYKTITWASSNTSVATVDKNGKVTAVSAGTATITATTINGKDVTCTVTVTATTPGTASEDEWNFVKKADLSDGDITEDTNFLGDKGNLTLNVLVKTGTGIGTKGTRACKYDSTMGLGFKKDILKIDNIKGSVKVVIQWYLNGSSNRNLEIAMGNGELEKVASGESKGDKTAYTNTFDAGEGKTLYIAASDWLYIKSITITPQSGSGTGTQPSTPTDPDLSGKTISLTDTPLGYASKGTSYVTMGGKTVTNRADLLSAIKSGGVIIIDGMIDMSEGKLPAEGTGTDADMTGFDAFVSGNSTYTSYKALRDAYVAGCSTSTNDKDSDKPESSVGKTLWSLNKMYGELIKLNLQSDTTLIGKGANCGIRGGSIQISGKSNIQIRNLTIKDAFDPFPHHEKNDGYNAQWDGINIQGASKNIWIDHCTLMDTCTLGFVKTGGSKEEKWQVYDGLCDIKGNSEYITVSNCKFYQHDKTMLIGNDDNEGLTVTRTITLYRNYFFNCGQRLPMVRNSDIHILNNYYDYDGSWYLKDGQQYAIGVRANANVYSENNYFGDKISYSVSGTADKTQGTLYRTGDAGKTSVKSGQFKTSDTPLFTPSYTLDKLEASAVPNSVKASAGAGYTLKQ
ncbi:MAG: Ig-like domain-containing protein [Treponemataceae bacterium]|nr:Ig-like domain-containing protein [Treponemataceae bacterium]MDE7391271.1 Ig-like domain-containing protein [Treponemataceae bacterium]